MNVIPIERPPRADSFMGWLASTLFMLPSTSVTPPPGDGDDNEQAKDSETEQTGSGSKRPWIEQEIVNVGVWLTIALNLRPAGGASQMKGFQCGSGRSAGRGPTG